jgi:phosphoribosylamine-glycine ligase
MAWQEDYKRMLEKVQGVNTNLGTITRREANQIQSIENEVGINPGVGFNKREAEYFTGVLMGKGMIASSAPETSERPKARSSSKKMRNVLEQGKGVHPGKKVTKPRPSY